MRSPDRVPAPHRTTLNDRPCLPHYDAADERPAEDGQQAPNGDPSWVSAGGLPTEIRHSERTDGEGDRHHRVHAIAHQRRHNAGREWLGEDHVVAFEGRKFWPSVARRFTPAELTFTLQRETSNPPTQPGGFFFGFAAGGAMLTVRLSIRRSLVRPGLPANRTEQPIAARCVSEAQEEWCT